MTRKPRDIQILPNGHCGAVIFAKYDVVSAQIQLWKGCMTHNALRCRREDRRIAGEPKTFPACCGRVS